MDIGRSRASSLTRMIGTFEFNGGDEIGYDTRAHPGLHPEPLDDCKPLPLSRYPLSFSRAHS
jgi:hypothetical protein